MLSGMALALVRNLTDIDRVRQQAVDVAARQGFAAALIAVRGRRRFCSEPEAIGLLFDPAHAAELAIEREDMVHALGLGGIDDQRAIARVIAERHVAAHPHAFLL